MDDVHPVGHRGGGMRVRDSAGDLVALIRPDEEDDLAEQVAPTMGQPSADAVDEFGHGQVAGF
jgi:hypothetical protein